MFSIIPWWGKLIGALSICGLIWFSVHTVQGWHADSKKLPEVEAALKAELACSIPSKCATDAIEKAKESVKAVQAAQAQAQADNDRKEAERQANEQEAAKRNTEHLKQLQKEVDQANLKLMQHASPQCKEWLETKIPCDIQ